jgi:hypothetical protein
MNNDIVFAKRNSAKLFFQRNQPEPPKAPKKNTYMLSGEKHLLNFIKTHKNEKIKRIY